jgi:hypothetical protein
MKHTQPFTAARDALDALLAESVNPEVIENALDLLKLAGAEFIQGEPEELPPPSDPSLFHILPAARDVLGEYAALELPVWGSAECARLFESLCYAAGVLELLSTLNALCDEPLSA